MQPKLDISVFYPAYNEGENIERLTRQTVEALTRLAGQWEVIIVDDGSKDNTQEAAVRLAKEIPGVRYIRHEKNQGYGGAVKTGMKAARLPWIFFTGGDGQFDTREIEFLLPAAQESDFVAGYRIQRQDSFMRKLNAFCWGTLVRTLFGLQGKVRDIDCAFKLFKRRVVDENDFLANGAMISTELLARAKKWDTGLKKFASITIPAWLASKPAQIPGLFYGHLRNYSNCINNLNDLILPRRAWFPAMPVRVAPFPLTFQPMIFRILQYLLRHL